MHDDPLEGVTNPDGPTPDGGDEPVAPPEDWHDAAAANGLDIMRTAPFDGGGSDEQPPPLGRAWHQELPRWLATLDSPRTRREYEKAVTYFFRTPGVPQVLEDLTFDLLIAYRGSLAVRAERRIGGSPAPAAGGRMRHAAIQSRRDAMRTRLMPGTGGVDEDAADEGDDTTAAGGRIGDLSALAPATVNVRLTALRQFLAHCSLWGELPRLAPERIRAALRRLRIERRRPYQVLAEPEWNAFLGAARAPLARPAALGTPEPDVSVQQQPLDGGDAPDEGDDEGHDEGQARSSGGPLWGVPRAVRRRLAGEREQQVVHGSADADRANAGRARARAGALARSRAGLTGARTAQRDHALLALALATGLRAIELCALDVGDLSREWHAGQEEWWLVLPDAKTKGQRGGRTLPLAPELVETLLAYVRATGRHWESAADRNTPLFLSRRHAEPDGAPPSHEDRSAQLKAQLKAQLSWRRLSPEQVRRIVDRVEAQWIANTMGAGDGDGRAISPHALRHSTAVALLEGNERSGRPPASVEHVRGWLGHFDIRTTQGYLAHLDARRNRRPFALQTGEGQTRPTSETAHRDAAPGADEP